LSSLLSFPTLDLLLWRHPWQVSDRAAQGVYDDVSGPQTVQRLNEFSKTFPDMELQVVATKVVPDEEGQIVEVLEEWTHPGSQVADAFDPCTRPLCNLILTTGGTGLSRRDVTPEATQRVLHKTLRALTTLLVMETSKVQPLACLSRGVAGTVGTTVILNLPGSPVAVDQYLQVALPILPFAVQQAERTSRKI